MFVAAHESSIGPLRVIFETSAIKAQQTYRGNRPTPESDSTSQQMGMSAFAKGLRHCELALAVLKRVYDALLLRRSEHSWRRMWCSGQLEGGRIMSRQTIISLVVAAIVGISSIALVSTNAMAQGYGANDSGRAGPNVRYHPSGVYYRHHGNYWRRVYP
jgi:hypothetical protein